MERLHHEVSLFTLRFFSYIETNTTWIVHLISTPECEALLYIKSLLSQYFLQYLQPPAPTTHTHAHAHHHPKCLEDYIYKAWARSRYMMFKEFLHEKKKNITYQGGRKSMVSCTEFLNNNTKTHSLTQVKCIVNAWSKQQNNWSEHQKKNGVWLDSLKVQILLKKLLKNLWRPFKVKHQYDSAGVGIKHTWFFF